MSNHFTGLSLGPPLGDQRLDLCDLYAFQSPTDSSRTVLILNANPNADALHPDAIYRLAIDTDGDLVNDIAFSFVFSSPVDGRQTVNVFMARAEQSRSPEPIGEQIFTDVEVSFGSQPSVVTAGDVTLPPAPAAMPSSSTSTASRTCSTPAASAISPLLISPNSEANRRGRARIRIPRPMSARWRSSCRRARSARRGRSGSGVVAACARTAH